jgi:predicted DNA-binding transcriptional regulator AlpA
MIHDYVSPFTVWQWSRNHVPSGLIQTKFWVVLNQWNSRAMTKRDKIVWAPFPDVGFVRLQQIIGDPKADPPLPPVIPVSRATWWAGVKSGRFPKSVKLGPRTTVWRASDILAFIDMQVPNDHQERK